MLAIEAASTSCIVLYSCYGYVEIHKGLWKINGAEVMLML